MIIIDEVNSFVSPSFYGQSGRQLSVSQHDANNFYGFSTWKHQVRKLNLSLIISTESGFNL